MASGEVQLKRLRNQIARTNLPEAEAEIVNRFDDELTLRAHEYSKHRHEKLLRHIFSIARATGRVSESLEDRDAAEDIVRWINRNYDNEETNSDFRTALRVFGRYVSEGEDEIPPSISWVSSGTSKSYNPAPNPAEMLKWEDDIKPMISDCKNDRDRAMIAVAWDLGARSGEFRKIKLGDLSDSKYGIQVHLDGKKGERSPTLIPSVPYLQQWLNKHPRNDDDTAYLWCKLESGDEMSYNMFRKIFGKAAERADVTKPVTLTNFRKSSASYLASQGVSQAHLEDHHGWVRGSRHAARYVSIFGDAAEREIAKAHGIEIEEEDSTPTHTPVECPRCEKESPPDEDFCIWCHQALQAEAVEEMKEQTTKSRNDLLTFAVEYPEIFQELDSIEDFLVLLDQRPESIDDAKAFIETMSD